MNVMTCHGVKVTLLIKFALLYKEKEEKQKAYIKLDIFNKSGNDHSLC